MKNLFLTALLCVSSYWAFSNSLMAYYPFNNGVTDESGNSNNGTLHGNAFVSNGMLFLDGNGDYVSVPDDPTLTPSDQITMYVKFTANDVSGSSYFIHKAENSPYKGYAMRILNGKIGFTFGNNNLQNYSQGTILSGQEYCVAITYDGTQYKVYINNLLDSYGNAPHDFNTSEELLIGMHGQVNDYFNGEIDEIRLYDYALSLDEISALCTEQYMMAYYPFNNGVTDESGNGNNGTLHGNAFVSNGMLFLDGNGDYVSVPDDPTLTPSDQITMYVKFTANDVSGSSYFIHKAENSPYKGYAMRILNGKIGFTFGNNNLQNYSQGTILSGQEYCVAITYDGTQYKVYINNLLDSYGNAPHDFNTSEELLIGMHGQVNDYFNGEIEEIRLYNYPLTENELVSICQNVSVDDIFTQEMKLYPNPVNDHLNISTPGNFTVRIELIDNYGRLILNTRQETSIDLSALNPGLYLARVFDSNNHLLIVKRIIKE